MKTVNEVKASPDTGQQPAAPTRQQRIIQGALPIVARAIGRQMNVEVHIGGHEAKTDGRVILLPTLPFNDPEVETLAFGFLEHEAAHIRYTRAVESQSELHHFLCNTIEDIRIERELAREFPGFGSDLARLTTKLVKDDVLKRPSPENSNGIKLRQYLSYRLRADLLRQQGLVEYADQAEAIFRQTFPAGACTRVGSIIGRAPAMRSTQNASDLAAEILAILEEESQDPPPPPSPPSGSEKNASAPSAGGSTGVDSGVAPSAEEIPVAGDGGTPVDPSAQRANLRDLLSSPSPQMGPEMSEAIGKALQRAAPEAVSRSGGSAGGFGRADAPITPPPGDPGQILSEVHEASTALRTRLRSFVESVRHARRSYTRHGTRLAPQRAVHAMLGDPRIFAHKRPGREVNTAVLVLCDRSGSMAGQRMLIASRSALAAASGLGAIRGMSVETAVFPGYEHDIELLTQFDEPLRRTATRYGAVEACGGTPLFEALMWGFERLLLQNKPRRILLCLTDGQPPVQTIPACRQAIDAAVAGGIEIYAIGIAVPDITTVFPVARSIGDVSELAQAMFGFLQSAITGRSAG